MEFLRFGSTIPGSYWGCCACDIIQNFKVDPDAKASIQLVSGDGGTPITGEGGQLFAGPTHRDIFFQRIRYGTFDRRDMPNHAFLAIITESQIQGTHGRAWLQILREAGFEFVRTVCNSVYAGPTLLGKAAPGNSSKNHIFGLFRNIGAGAISDPFTPPKAWTDMPVVTPEAWQFVDKGKEFADSQREAQVTVWDKIGPPKFMTEKQLEADGVPITYAGMRSKYPQQPKTVREQIKATEAAAAGVKPVNAFNPKPVAA